MVFSFHFDHCLFDSSIAVVRTVGDAVGRAVLIEKKLANKEDLKLADLLRYYVADGQAAKDLMYRRIKVHLCSSLDSFSQVHVFCSGF